MKIVSPQYVKPFVRVQTNDGNDAEAICTAVRQPHMPLVPGKTVEQQDIQALNRARQRLINHRTATVCKVRGLLLDRGFAIAQSITRVRRLIPEILNDLGNELTRMAREMIAELWDLFCDLDRRIASFERKICATRAARKPDPTGPPRAHAVNWQYRRGTARAWGARASGSPRRYLCHLGSSGYCWPASVSMASGGMS